MSVVVAVACSGSDKSFFDGPPVVVGGGGSGGTGARAAAGSSGKLTEPGGTGESAGMAADGAGAAAGDDGAVAGSPDTTGGAGDVTGAAGEGTTSGRGGTGGSPNAGGSGGSLPAGGSPANGGSAGTTSATGGAGSGGDVNGGSGGLGGSAAGTDASGGVAGTLGLAGLGGFGAFAGTGGSATCVPTVPSDEICDGIDNDCRGGIDDRGACPDGCVGAVYSDHRYLLCNGPGNTTYSRLDAHDACSDHGDDLGITLDLVRVNSADEEAFVLGLISANNVSGAVWNGASDSGANGIDSTEGTWVWGSSDNGVTFYEDGAPVMSRYNDWADGQPDDGGSGQSQDCAVFDPAYGWKWNDVVCSQTLPAFVCEEPSR